MNPLNQLPIDPAMIRLVDEEAARIARLTGHMVLMFVMKEDGKTHIAAEGVPASGFLHDLSKDWPHFLEVTANLIRLHDQIEKENAQ